MKHTATTPTVATVRIRCGKCSRVLDRVTAQPDQPVYSDWTAFDHEAGQPKPSVGRLVTEERQRYRCHRKCGADWAVRLARFDAAVRAAWADRRDVTMGIDV